MGRKGIVGLETLGNDRDRSTVGVDSWGQVPNACLWLKITGKGCFRVNEVENGLG